MTGFSKEKRQKQGSVYTPPEIIQWIHDKLIEQSPLDLNKKYWDPACGTGRFPIDWYNRLIEHWNHNQDKYPELDSIEKVHRHIIEKCLYFSDIDPFAIRLCRFALYLKCPQVTNVKFNSYCGDSLLEDPFSEVEKFDYVAGNPPYIQFKVYFKKCPNKKELMQEKFTSLIGKGDILYCFIALGIKRSNTIGMITSKYWLGDAAGQSVRSYIVNNTMMTNLWDLGNDPTLSFKGVAVCSCMFVLSNLKKQTNFEYQEKDKSPTVRSLNLLLQQSWALSSDATIRVLNKIQSKESKLKDFYTVENGVELNKSLMLTFEKIKKYDLEQTNCHPTIKGDGIARYYTSFKNNYIVREGSLLEYPKLHTYLKVDEVKHNNKRFINRSRQVKILARYYTDENRLGFALNEQDYATTHHSVFQIVGNSIKFLLGILNSKVIRFYILKEGGTINRRANNFRITVGAYNEFPIPKKLDSRLDGLVEKMLKDPNDKVTEDEINKIVYELYDLSDDEIKMIEETLK